MATRITVGLDEHLLRQAKQFAASTNRSLTAVIEAALRLAMARRPGISERKPIQLTTFKGRGLMPGVDLDDTASLLGQMERPERPAGHG